VTPRLNLNLGLRYDLFPPYYEKNNAVSSFDPAKHAVVLGTPVDNLVKLGYTFPSIVNRLTDMGMKFETYDQAGLPKHMINTSKDGFGPRLGFAYRMGDGSKSLVVRGGYRISYFHFVMGGWAARMRQNVPMTARFYWSQTQAAYSPDGIANLSLRTVPQYISGQNTTNLVQPSDASKSLARGCCGISYFNSDMPDPRVQDWNFTVEKEIMPNTVARAGYIGNHSTRLEQLYQYNNNTTAPRRLISGTRPRARRCPPVSSPTSAPISSTERRMGSSSAGRTPAGATPMASSSNWSATTPRVSRSRCST